MRTAASPPSTRNDRFRRAHPRQSTVHAVLDRHGLVSRARKRRAANDGQGAVGGRPAQRSVVHGFQGRAQDRRRPLLLPPDSHRPGLAHDPSVRSPREHEGTPVTEAFLGLFRARGPPQAIRSDNGLPFASPNGLYNLSKLSVWWLSAFLESLSGPAGGGIPLPRPGHPRHCLRPHLHGRKKINVSTVFGGQRLCIEELDDGIWLVSFMHYDLGYFDDETCRLEPLQNPFGPKVLPMSSE